ncbi:MAG: IS701 family transposase [Clostridiales bacterium]|jgi:SRSO17 transposase|nr:IS701 family transposase [Clostridiales bacterium]
MEMPTLKIDTALEELTGRISKVFKNKTGKETAKKYIEGLLSPVERKNGWQLSEALGKETPYALQQFLYRGKFSADGLRDELRSYIDEKLGDDEGILVADETGFLKQGKMSCGVKRQYSGTAGRIENCQIGVFLTYASEKGHAPLDRRLYIPENWFEEPERCRKAGIPETAEFQTKPAMALEMIRQATDAGVRYKWVTGDCVYGDYRNIRLWLEEQRKCYVLCVSGKEYFWQGFKQIRISNILKNLPEDAWFEASCGDGSKGSRIYDWQSVGFNSPQIDGFKHCLLIRRSKTDPEDLRAYVCFSPSGTQTEKLVKIAGTRWTVERCFSESKSQVGLDQYEVRSHDGWYKHITLACLALALLTVISADSGDKFTMQQHNPSSSSLEGFKKGRGLRV